MNRVWLLTDRTVAGGIDPLLERVSAVAELVGVILRDKDLHPPARLALGHKLRARCPRLLVARDHELARQIGADGVHLEDGQAWQRQGHTGGAAHDVDGAHRLFALGADHVTLSPIWPTESKPGATGLGLESLSRCSRISEPRPGLLLALGGIDGATRARQARQAGADGVAVIRAVLGAPDPVAAALGLVAACA